MVVDDGMMLVDNDAKIGIFAKTQMVVTQPLSGVKSHPQGLGSG